MTPRPLQIALVILCTAPMLLGLLWPEWTAVGVAGVFTIVLAALVDLIVTPSPKRLVITRDASDIISLGTENAVGIVVQNPSRTRLRLLLFDTPPQPSRFTKLPGVLVVAPGETETHWYRVEPLKRGENEFGLVYVKLASRFRLWDLHHAADVTQTVRVFPNVRAIAALSLLARRNKMAQAGVHVAKLRGRGSDFDRLREYRREDELRSIDWKATARHQELISKEYVVERDQTVLILLDCGRSMRNEQDGVAHFDRALNAAILLTDMASRQGDSVGLLACSNKIEAWVPPVKGQTAARRLVQQIYDLPASEVATDYDLLAEQVRLRHRKRSLVILLTHALDEVHTGQIRRGLEQLKRPHLVLGTFLQNTDLIARADQVPDGTLDAFQVAAASELVQTQEAEIASLSHSGFQVLHCPPEELALALVNAYLEIKSRHLL